MRSAITLLLALLSFAVPALGTTIEVEESYPAQGERVLVHVRGDSHPLVAARLRITYRPNSQTVFTEQLTTDESGTVGWIPRDAGIVLLEVLDSTELDPSEPDPTVLASTRVAVRFGQTPASGILVMSLAGLLLFGGATAAFWLLLSSPDLPDPLEAEPPST